jgi:hypothetical protein
MFVMLCVEKEVAVELALSLKKLGMTFIRDEWQNRATGRAEVTFEISDIFRFFSADDTLFISPNAEVKKGSARARASVPLEHVINFQVSS